MNISNEPNCSLFFAGDICIAEPIKDDFIADDLLNLIKNHDLRVANWEAPIIDEKCEKAVKAGPHIHQDNTYEKFLNKNIFNIFSLANNHSLDYGLSGLKKTQDELKHYAQTTGANTNFETIYEPLIVIQNDIKIAVIACAEAQFGCSKYEEYGGGYAWILSNKIQQTIEKTKKEVDFIVVLPHAGLEMEDLPLPEWRECYKNFIDLGADLVVASHPHVIQPKEYYKGKYIYYSLGNFLFNMKNSDNRWDKSLGISCQFTLKNREKIITIKECFISNNNNQLCLNNSPDTIFNELNIKLLDTLFYYDSIKKTCLEAWNDYYESYYTYFSQDFRSNYKWLPEIIVKVIIKLIKKYLHTTIQKDQVLLYHNISIETHRYAVERALRDLNKIK